MRYLLKFYKDGYIRFTSHLDMLRLFKRSFKRAEIKLQYSQGFNPHPKMSFAQPLSLGYFSSGEYLEFDTVNEMSAEEIKDKLNALMPDGLGILKCSIIPSGGKTVAGLIEAGQYEITLPSNMQTQEMIQNQINAFLKQDHIMIKKHQKKTGKDLDIDIKPLIFQLNCASVDNNNIMVQATIATGSTSNLNPEYLIHAFLKFIESDIDRADISIKRTELFSRNNNQTLPLESYFS